MEAKKVKSLMEAYASVYENEQLDEFLGPKAAEMVDSATKKIQGGLEKMGVKINRTKRGTTTKADQEKRIQQNNSADLFDIVKGHLLDEGYAETEEAALAIMANMSEDWRNEIVESMASANRMKEIKEKGFERPARSREFEKRLPTERGSRGPEFEHGSTRSFDKPSGNLSANRGGGKGGARSREFEHGSTRSMNTPSKNLGDGLPRDKKGNIMR